MKSVILSLVGLITATTLIGVVPVFAQSASTMTDQHIARIKLNCQDAIVTLSQIHASDAPVYINRNQTYFSITDKLMARLNGRLALNRYDVTQLVKVASSYNDELAKFRTAYKEYDDLMSGVVHSDCTKEPVGFYDKVGAARVARQKVHDITDQLTLYINQYQDEVKAFQTQHFPATGEVRP
jgi:hypothetical protein